MRKDSDSNNQESPILLALDTSGETIISAINLAGKIHSLSAGRAESRQRNIAVLTNELLESLSLTFADVSAVIVALGPGSFTGLRVGLSFAKGLVAASEIDLIGVTRFQQVLWQLNTEGQAVPDSMFIHLKADSYYRCNSAKKEEGAVDVVTIEEIVNSGGSLCFIDCQIPTIDDQQPDSKTFLKVFTVSSSLESLFNSGLEISKNGIATSWTDLEPLYIQRSAAELRAEKSQNAN